MELHLTPHCTDGGNHTVTLTLSLILTLTLNLTLNLTLILNLKFKLFVFLGGGGGEVFDFCYHHYEDESTIHNIFLNNTIQLQLNKMVTYFIQFIYNVTFVNRYICKQTQYIKSTGVLVFHIIGLL